MVTQLEHLGLQQGPPAQQPMLRRVAPVPGEQGRHSAPLDPQDHAGLVARGQAAPLRRTQHTQAPAGIPGQLHPGPGRLWHKPQGVADRLDGQGQGVVAGLAVVQQVAHGQAAQQGQGPADVIRVRVGQHQPVQPIGSQFPEDGQDAFAHVPMQVLQARVHQHPFATRGQDQGGIPLFHIQGQQLQAPIGLALPGHVPDGHGSGQAEQQGHGEGPARPGPGVEQQEGQGREPQGPAGSRLPHQVGTGVRAPGGEAVQQRNRQLAQGGQGVTGQAQDTMEQAGGQQAVTHRNRHQVQHHASHRKATEDPEGDPRGEHRHGRAGQQAAPGQQQHPFQPVHPLPHGGQPGGTQGQGGHRQVAELEPHIQGLPGLKQYLDHGRQGQHREQVLGALQAACDQHQQGHQPRPDDGCRPAAHPDIQGQEQHQHPVPGQGRHPQQGQQLGDQHGHQADMHAGEGQQMGQPAGPPALRAGLVQATAVPEQQADHEGSGFGPQPAGDVTPQALAPGQPQALKPVPGKAQGVTGGLPRVIQGRAPQHGAAALSLQPGPLVETMGIGRAPALQARPVTGPRRGQQQAAPGLDRQGCVRPLQHTDPGAAVAQAVRVPQPPDHLPAPAGGGFLPQALQNQPAPALEPGGRRAGPGQCQHTHQGRYQQQGPQPAACQHQARDTQPGAEDQGPALQGGQQGGQTPGDQPGEAHPGHQPYHGQGRQHGLAAIGDGAFHGG
jgi:hypothetical protein